jgi:hypothetical protein
MSVYSKKKQFEDPLARNMFIRSNMDYCMTDKTSGVNEFIYKKKKKLRTLWPEICSLGHILTTVWLR